MPNAPDRRRRSRQVHLRALHYRVRTKALWDRNLADPNRQRAGKLRPEERAAQLESYVSSAMSKWSDPQLGNALQSWDGFCNLLHFAGFEDYFIQQQASQIEDWSTVELTEEGKALKARIDAAHHVRCHLRFSSKTRLTHSGTSFEGNIYFLQRQPGQDRTWIRRLYSCAGTLVTPSSQYPG